MRTTTAGLRYAKALFSLALDERATGLVCDQLEMLNGFLTESSELRRALLTPLHPASERKAVLNKLADRADLSPLLRNFILYLIDQRRLIDMSGIAEEFNRLVDDEEGRMSAEVTTATPLDSAHEERLREALSRRTGREVRLEIKVDASLIGGAVAKVGDLVFDGSLRTQLDTLRTHLMKGS